MTMPLRLTMSHLYEVDNVVRLAFEGARTVVDARAIGDKELAHRAQRDVVNHARYLENGLTKLRAEQDKFDNLEHPHPDPSTTIKAKHPCRILPPVGERRAVFQSVMARGKAAFPGIHGLVYVTTTRAYFQIHGDPTPYSVAISLEEAVALGYIVV